MTGISRKASGRGTFPARSGFCVRSRLRSPASSFRTAWPKGAKQKNNSATAAARFGRSNGEKIQAAARSGSGAQPNCVPSRTLAIWKVVRDIFSEDFASAIVSSGDEAARRRVH